MLTGDWTRSGGLAWRHVLQPRNGEAEPKCICPWWLGTRKLQVGANGWTCPARTGVTTVVLVLPGSQGAKERQKLGEADARLCFPVLFSKCLLAFVPMGSAVLHFAFMEKHVTQVTGTGSGVTQTQVHGLPWYHRSCENVQMLNLSKPPSPHLQNGAKTSQVCRED